VFHSTPQQPSSGTTAEFPTSVRLFKLTYPGYELEAKVHDGRVFLRRNGYANTASSSCYPRLHSRRWRPSGWVVGGHYIETARQ